MSTSMYTQLIESQEYADALHSTTIIGVAGTNGAGKDCLLDLLVEKGFLIYNTGDHVRPVAYATFRSVERGSNDAPVGKVANAIRRQYPGGMVELGLIDWWARAAHLPEELRPRGLAIGSIRGTGEAARLKHFGGKLIVVDADRQLRYDRIYARGRSDEPGITYEQFCEKEEGEMAYGETDPTRFGMAAVIDSADAVIRNESTLDDFAIESAKVLAGIGITL